MIQNIAIVGAGAIGMTFGGYLTDKLGYENVGFVCDPARLARYKANTFRCNGMPCNFRFINAAQKGGTADLVIFCTKATQLESAMDNAANIIGRNTVIISLLNGIISEGILEARFGCKNVLYSVAQGMDATKDGFDLTYTHIGQVRLGIPAEHPEKRPALEAVIELFDRVEFPYVLEEDIMHRLWSKLMLNVGVNQICMVYEGNYGTIQKDGPARSEMIAAMREVMLVAKYKGINLTEEDLSGYVALMDTLEPSGMPSMRQDGLAHRKSEVELFAGTICRLGEEFKVDVPVNRKLYATVQAMEAKY